MLKLQSWEEEGVLTGSHGECSDPYYQWYADHDIRDRGAVYHVCTGKHSTCRFKLPRGDRRIVIHLDRWRLLSPAIMIRSDYMKEKGERQRQSCQAGHPIDPQGIRGLRPLWLRLLEVVVFPRLPRRNGGRGKVRQETRAPRKSARKDARKDELRST